MLKLEGRLKDTGDIYLDENAIIGMHVSSTIEDRIQILVASYGVLSINKTHLELIVEILERRERY